jgi:hypothetical protein
MVRNRFIHEIKAERRNYACGLIRDFALTAAALVAMVGLGYLALIIGVR